MSHVLVIEDDPALRELYALMFSRDGHSVAEAENGLEGLTRLRDRLPDVVLTDIMMPVLDGIGFIRAARREFPDVRIVAMSGGFAAAERLAEAAESGANVCLAKPFGLAELRSACSSTSRPSPATTCVPA